MKRLASIALVVAGVLVMVVAFLGYAGNAIPYPDPTPALLAMQASRASGYLMGFWSGALAGAIGCFGMWRCRRSGARTSMLRAGLGAADDSSTPLRQVVLRDVDDADGSRLLTAAITPAGDVRIEGRDCGPGVERVWGSPEYEWAWTVRARHADDLRAALGADDADLLRALAARFSGERAADLGEFLASHGIPTERWSRTGD